jgi:hypothetical protein
LTHKRSVVDGNWWVFTSQFCLPCHAVSVPYLVFAAPLVYLLFLWVVHSPVFPMFIVRFEWEFRHTHFFCSVWEETFGPFLPSKSTPSSAFSQFLPCVSKLLQLPVPVLFFLNTRNASKLIMVLHGNFLVYMWLFVFLLTTLVVFNRSSPLQPLNYFNVFQVMYQHQVPVFIMPFFFSLWRERWVVILCILFPLTTVLVVSL